MPQVRIQDGTSVKVVEVVEGTSLHDVMLLENPEIKNWPKPTVCIYEGAPVLREKWATTFLHKGSRVIFTTLPQGKIGKIILGIVGVVLMVVAPFVGGIYGTVMGLSGAVLTQLAMTPSRPSSQSGIGGPQASPTYSIGATGNVPRPYQPVPELFGKMRVVPDPVATPWTQYINNEMFLYQVFGLGRGEVDVHELYFGHTMFWKNGYSQSPYEDVVVQIVPVGQRVTLFPDNVVVNTNVASQELLQPAAGGTWLGPFTTNPSGTAVTEILLDFIFPRGLGYMHQWGTVPIILPYYVGVEAEYRALDDNGNPTSGWIMGVSKSFGASTLTALRFTETIKVPAGRYEVRCRRSSNGVLYETSRLEETRWEGMRAIIPGSLTYEQTVIAVKIKASNLLSQQAAQNFQVLMTRKLPLYDRKTKTWSAAQPTRSFAAAISHVCKAQYGGNLSDHQFDLDKLWAIDEIITEKGWSFDFWCDGAYTVWGAITEFCAAVMTMPKLMKGKLTFVMEAPDRPVRYEFNPSDIIRGSLSPMYATYDDTTVDDVIIEYLDEAREYQLEDVRAVLPGSTNRQPARRRPPGIVKRAQALAIGVYASACNKHRRIALTFDVEGKGRLISRGDVVRVVHPRFNDFAFGFVSEWNKEALSIKLDLTTDLVIGEHPLYAAFTRRNGTLWGPVKLASCSPDGEIVLDPFDYATLLEQGFESPFSFFVNSGDRKPTGCTLQEGKQYKWRMLVENVKHINKFRFSVRVINDAPEVYSYQIAIPPYDYRGQLPVLDALEAVRGLAVRPTDSQETATLLITWLPVPGATEYLIETSLDGLSFTRRGSSATNTFTAVVPSGDVWVRVAPATSTLQGPWSSWVGNTTITVPPPPVPLLEGSYTGGKARIKWFSISGVDQYDVRVDHVMTPVLGGSLSDTVYNITPEAQQPAGGPFRSLVVNVRSSNQAGLSVYNQLTITDEPPAPLTNVTGYITNGIVYLNSGVPVDEASGFIAVRLRGPAFTSLADVLETKVTTSLPIPFAGVDTSIDTFFGIAAKDAFFDITGDYGELNFELVTIPGVPA